MWDAGAMRLLILSDLHLEKRPLAGIVVPADGFDALVCAGDVCDGEPERGVAALTILAQGRPVILVPGNHERYRRGEGDPRNADRMLAEWRAAADASGCVTILEGGASQAIGDVAFIGATLWTDFSLAGLWRPGLDAGAATAAAIARVVDPRTGSREFAGAILAAPGRFWHPDDARAAHCRDAAALRRALATVRAPVRVVVTHHPPLARMLAPYRDAPGVPWWVPAFYGSTMLAGLPEPLRPDLWIFGHFHARYDAVEGGTRCVANPVAAADYEAGFVVDLGGAEGGSAAAG